MGHGGAVRRAGTWGGAACRGTRGERVSQNETTQVHTYLHLTYYQISTLQLADWPTLISRSPEVAQYARTDAEHKYKYL